MNVRLDLIKSYLKFSHNCYLLIATFCAKIRQVKINLVNNMQFLKFRGQFNNCLNAFSMKRIIIVILFVLIASLAFAQTPIIADHTVVEKYNKIPQQYINEVKKMWMVLAGESHSEAYRTGLTLLESLYPTYAVSVVESGTPEEYTTSNLRASRATWGDYYDWSGWIYAYGEEDWFTNETALERTKAGITYCNTNNLEIAAIGFGWCWDATTGTHTAAADPILGVHWYGESKYGPEGNKAWGLDATDSAQTENSVCLDTYLHATQEYIDYCTANGYTTKVFFTTGTVDIYTGEAGYQGYLKYERIRDYVNANPSRILFDYADILCYDDDGTPNTTTWNGHTYPIITTTNLGDASVGHIGSAGAIRLAKAMWWMLARIAGWDGGTTTIPVTGITVTGAGGATAITTDNGTLQLNAAITPANATNKTVTWSVVNGTGQATISSTGLVTAVANGIVTARATANDGSGILGTFTITISDQTVFVTGITITGAGGDSIITISNGTLQLTATISPANATNKKVTWSVVNGTGQATISSTGLVTAVANGTVTARATANDGSAVSDSLEIMLSNQVVSVESINIVPMDETIPIIIVKNSKLIIRRNSGNSGTNLYALYTIQGVLIRSEKTSDESIEINISHYPSGIYIVILSKDQQVFPLKVVIP